MRSAKHEQKNGLPVGRSSLDSKRVPSRSVTPTDKRLTKEGQEEGKNTGGSLRSQTSELARGQRNVFVPTPVLVNPTPTLTIESPRSSSSSFHLPNPAANNASVSHTSLTSAGLESSSPFSPPGHLETQTPRLEKRGTPDSFKGDTKHSKARVPSPHRIFGQGANPNLRSLPPPVNRAEKPKVPPKRVIDNVPGRASLEPEVSTPNEGVSPFSTPPSSDNESPGVDGPSTEARNRLDVKPAQLGGLDGYSPRTLPVKPSQDHNSRHGHISDSNAKAIDARLDDFSRYRDNAMDMPSQRPGLPPRIGEEVSPRPLTINVPEVPRGVRKDDANVQPHGAQHSLSPSLPKHRMVRSSTDFLPPPRRTLPSHNYTTPARRSESPAKRAIPSVSRVSNDLVRSQMQTNDANGSDEAAVVGEVSFAVATEYPDISQSSRRKPKLQRGAQEIDTRYDTRLLDICGEHVCTSGFLTRAWDLTTGENIMSLSHGEKELKVTALAFRPEATADKEGSRIWIGTNFGDLQEVDLSIKEVTSTKTNGHSRREITQIHRCQYNMWTLDEDGRLLVWKPEVGGLPTLQGNPISHKVPKGHTFSIVAKDQLWHATGKEIRVFRPNSDAERSFFITTTPLCQPNTGDVTSGAMVSSQLARIYFGHSDGKITIYSTEDYSCLGVVNVSIYKINSMAGAGDFLWAGYNTGMIYVYDTRTHPWTVKKDWHAHANPVVQIIADKSSVWKLGVLQVASLGTDNVIKMWEGMLEDDWLGESLGASEKRISNCLVESDMQDHDTEYCDFRELKAVVVTWNAGASTPSSLSGGERSAPFKAAIKVEDPPDILVFGFQELVDLEDKKLTASMYYSIRIAERANGTSESFFKGKKKDPSEQEHMSRQYRDWRDYLTRYLEDNMPASHSYQLLHTASLVGLFSCVYVKTSERSHVHKLSAAEIKRGMGGLHGNKVGLTQMCGFLVNIDHL